MAELADKQIYQEMQTDTKYQEWIAKLADDYARWVKGKTEQDDQ